jgi:hypothetical protein
MSKLDRNGYRGLFEEEVPISPNSRTAREIRHIKGTARPKLDKDPQEYQALKVMKEDSSRPVPKRFYEKTETEQKIAQQVHDTWSEVIRFCESEMAKGKKGGRAQHIASMLGMKTARVGTIMTRMIDAGVIKRIERGLYVPTGEPLPPIRGK